ncbi:hypothetical protein FB451DRAFT_1555784 [Mycena latifolia]|nr:hypothetical protein FB451DRAFT_1555784 [Mycena latifolia]
MFNKSAFLLCALVASSAVAAPVPKLAFSFSGNDNIPSKAGPASAPLEDPVDLAKNSGVCNATALQDTITQMQSVAKEILAVNFVSNDPFREKDADIATFDTVVTAINDASTAAGAKDFATVSSKLAFISDTVDGLLTEDDKLQYGQVSGIDLELSSLADDSIDLVNACAAPAPAPPAAAPAAPVEAAIPPPKAGPASAPLENAADSGVCDATALQDKLTDMQGVAKEILAVNFIANDPFRQNDADIATFDTVVTAINDASTAAGAKDFATVSSKLAFISDTVDELLTEGDKLQNGQVSGIDLELSNLADDATDLVNACI